jgi:micrococcal nuclease
MRPDARLLVLVVALVVTAVLVWRHERTQLRSPPAGWEALDHVADGDTIVLRGGVTVRLVQIDTPEVYFHPECYGEQASAETKRLLHRGDLVRLVRDPVTSSTDVYGRLLRYVIRRDGLNVNLRLVADGAAAPYFFDGARGRYANALLRSAESARGAGKGLWGACPATVLDPRSGVATGDPLLGRRTTD